MKSRANKDSKKQKKEYRCTQFEYSSSDSDSDNENSKNKLNFPFLSKKVYKSSINKIKEGQKEKKKRKSKIYLSRYVRMILFFLLVIFNVIIDLDSGIISSCFKSFIKDLNLNDLQYGSLNSLSTAGKILSLLFYMIIINKNHRKFILITTSLIHGLSFYGYYLKNNYYYIACLLFLISTCKIFIIIYIPVWIDQFGIKKYKTLLLTLVYTVISYGRIAGAWIGTVIFNNDWKRAFSVCGFIFISLSFCLFLIPQKYFSTKYMIVEKQKKDNDIVVEKLVPTKDIENDIKNEIKNINDIDYINDENNKNNNDKKEKLIYDFNTKEQETKSKYKNISMYHKLRLVILNPCFIFSSLSRASLFFIFKIIHIFLKKYSFEVLNYNNEITFFYYYSLTTILAPSFGSLFGGIICNKFLGGYESRKSIYILIFFSTLAIFFITAIRYSNNFNSLIIYIFGYFFSVSAFLPTLSGYIINSLNKELKGFGSTFDNLITNLIGKLPSSIIYGLINDLYKNKDPKFAWNKCLMIYYLGLILIYLTCFFKWKYNNIKNKKIKNKNDIVEQTMKDYILNQSNLINAEKPIPIINNKKMSNPVELDDVDDISKNELDKKILTKKK